MHKRRMALMLLFAAGLFGAPTVGRAQYVAAFGQPGLPFNTTYQAASTPTVSPYLNLLAPTQFGVTNYQTWVRPMIEERDAQARQAWNLQQAQQRGVRTSPPVKHSQEDRPAAASRFLNYSHYYSDVRRPPQ